MGAAETVQFNPYILILSAFVLVGLATTLWGWKVLAAARRSRDWPAVPGCIEESRPGSGDNDLLPHIRFSYTLDGRQWQRELEFPSGTTPSQELMKQYLERFPRGADVQVHYDPQVPERVTLEPGAGQGDWLILAIGLFMAVLGIVLLLSAS